MLVFTRVSMISLNRGHSRRGITHYGNMCITSCTVLVYPSCTKPVYYKVLFFIELN